MVSLPTDFQNNFLIILRLVHFLAGITWIGLLYFFNLVSTPVAKEIELGARVKVYPKLMLRALWWFRWSAFVTVIVGLMYWARWFTAMPLAHTPRPARSWAVSSVSGQASGRSSTLC